MNVKKCNHILVVAPAFTQNHEQGIVIPPLQLYLLELTNRYPKLKISVIALHFPFTNEKYTFNNCNVYPMNGKNGSLFLRPIVWRKALTTFKKIHKETPVDCIHSFWYNEPAFLGNQMAKKINVPHISTLMGQDAKKKNSYLKFIRSNSMIRVTLSEFQKSVFESNSKYKIDAVIPFGISELDSNLWNLTSQERTVDLICVSSLIPLKQVHLFISLVASIKTKLPNIKAVVVGDGMFRRVIEDHIKHFGLEENVILLGKLPREECLSWMNQSKIFVHTSEYEAQGYVLNEALALGCKVGTLSNGLQVNHPNFFIAKDLQSFVNGLYYWLLNDEKEYESQVPIKMTDTLINYEQLFQICGVSFNPFFS